MKKFLVLTVAVLATMISFNLIAECTGLSFDPAVELLESSQGVSPNKLVSIDLTGIPSTLVGQLNIEFYPVDFDTESFTDYAVTGTTYNLGTGNNVGYDYCNQCVFMGFYDPSNDYAFVKSFFQQEGTLQLTKTDFVEQSHYYYEGVVSVKLAEAEIDDNSFETTFVEGGDCYEIQTAAFSNFPDDADTGDTGADTGADTGDTGDTGSEPTEPGDDTTPDETDDTGSNPADNNEDTDGTSENEAGSNEEPTANNSGYTPQSKEEDGGCSLVVL